MSSAAANVQRESACPVHFIWDGAGPGRWLVRLGFLGATAWGTAYFGALVFRFNGALPYIGWAAIPVATSWVVGQVLSMVAKQRRKRLAAP